METMDNIPKRAAGVLLPVSSLPAPYGIGSFGKAAREWIDFLSEAGQRYWQVLPLGPTGYGDSPYQSFSAFAGSPYYIDLDTLREAGLLRREEYADIRWAEGPGAVDYDLLYRRREPVLRLACGRFKDAAALAAFRAENADWLEDYALFMAVKAKSGQRPWTEWERGARLREPAAMERLRLELAAEIDYHVFVQYAFFRQWHALRAYAAQKGVQVIGDIPIYVAMDSADVWAHRPLFQLDENGAPLEVAGCPPDSFSREGQLWGNPLYDWDRMARDGYAWWIRRMRANFALFDLLRIDHFRGLESYYAIPAGHRDTKSGRWRPGPGMALINAIRAGVPEARIIAEDLGYLTDEVSDLLAQSGFPGMKVLQFAFDSREPGDYSPYGYGPNSVVYTGTHDNDTALGWARSASSPDVVHAMDYTGVRHRRDLPCALVRLAMQSAARLAVVPLQDWLELGSEARINTPGSTGGNWRWRLAPGALCGKLARKMRYIAELYGRLPDQSDERAE